MGLFDKAILRTEEAMTRHREREKLEKPPDEALPPLEIQTLEDFELHRRGPWKIPIRIGERFEVFEVDEIGPIYPNRPENAANAPCLRQALSASVWLSSASDEFLGAKIASTVDILRFMAIKTPFGGFDRLTKASRGAFLVGCFLNGLEINSSWHKQGRGLNCVRVIVPGDWLRRLTKAANEQTILSLQRRYPGRIPKLKP